MVISIETIEAQDNSHDDSGNSVVSKFFKSCLTLFDIAKHFTVPHGNLADRDVLALIAI